MEETDQTPQKLIKTIRSGVIHIEFFIDSSIVASGSGFLSGGYLITNNHVHKGPKNALVRLSWHPEATTSTTPSIIIKSDQFQSYLKSGSDANNHDYAILDVPELRKRDLHNFSLASHRDKNIFDEVLVIGFPLEHKNLVCHKGIISSFYTANKTNIIQIDASVNASNSGGPLVDLTNGNVIGIVTRKGTGLTKLFDQLFESFDHNISALNQAKGGMFLSGIDPFDVLIANQNQMKRLAYEITRSANVGIGYAFSIEHIQHEIDSLNEET